MNLEYEDLCPDDTDEYVPMPPPTRCALRENYGDVGRRLRRIEVRLDMLMAKIDKVLELGDAKHRWRNS